MHGGNSSNGGNKKSLLEKNKGKTILVIESDDDDYEYGKRKRNYEDDHLVEVEGGDEDEDFDEDRFWDILSNHPEWVDVDLSKVRASVQCPICLGIIKKTRIMNECLHRFCKECIDKSMRLGNKECPACRNHCASRRSLRDDPNFDAIIECLFDDVEKYEKEELAIHEEEETRNKQIQESIAKISQKQTEALVGKKGGKQALGKTHAYTTRSGGVRIEKKEPEYNQDEDSPNENKESFSADEIRHETKKRKYTKRKESTQPLPSPGNDSKLNKNRIENTHHASLLTPDLPSWGTSSVRSKSYRNNRVTRASKYLGNQKEKDLEQLDVNCVPVSLDEQEVPNDINNLVTRQCKHLNNQKQKDLEQSNVNCMLFSLDEQKVPHLGQLFHICPPSITVEHLKEYVASQMQFLGKDVEILLVKKSPSSNNMKSLPDLSTSVMQILDRQKTLAEVKAEYALNEDHLVLAYRLGKGNGSGRS